MTETSLPLYLSGAFLTSLILSLLGTYFVREWAIGRGHVDVPDEERRVHTSPTPNVGGIAVAVVTVVTFVAWSFFVVPGQVGRPDILAMLIGGLMIFAVGYWDDIRGLRAMTKFGLQIAIAGFAFVMGVRILGVGFGDLFFSPVTGFLSLFMTILWIVGTTNAFNLIDGSDGVAGGAAMFASISMAVIFALAGDPLGALMATILVGACLGFLFFNFPPASIFMGDCGSLFLGYTLATLGVVTTHKSSTLLAVTIPIIAFGVPLLDTGITVVRRYLRGEPIFAPDRGHIHHRLADLGLSSRSIAILLYIACAGCASLSLLLAAPGRPTVLPVFVVASAVLIVGVQRLNVPELTELRRVLHRGFQQRQVIAHNVRVHAAAEKVSRAETIEDVHEVVRESFLGSEFSRIEVLVDRGYLGGSIESDLAQRSTDGVLLEWRYRRVLHPEQEVELRVPVLSEGQRVARISLYRSTAGDRLFTDVRLVSSLLGPALAESLKGMAKGSVGGESQRRG